MTPEQTSSLNKVIGAAGEHAVRNVKKPGPHVFLSLYDSVWVTILDDGSQHWYKHGKRHRDDGPALINADGMQHWYQHDKFHREDGPAMIRADGTQAWFLNDKQLSKAEHAQQTR